MTQIPLPFEEDWTLSEMSIALKNYLHLLGDLTIGKDTTNSLFLHLKESRFIPTYGKRSCEPRSEGRTNMRESFARHKYFKQHSSILSSISANKTGIRELTLAAFAETAAFYSVGKENTNYFFQCTLI